MAANNYAIKFVGSSLDRIDFGTSAKGTTIKDLTAFTLEADIKTDLAATNPAAAAYIERQGSGKNARLALIPFNDTSLKKGVLRFAFSRRDNKTPTNYSYTLPTGYWDDYWHHVAFTVDIGEKEYRIFLDEANVAVGKITDGGLDGDDNPLHVANTTPNDIVVGASYNGSSYKYWSGKIDNIRLWNTVISEGSIYSESHDHIEDPGSVTSLIEEWRFNEGTGTSTVGIKNPSWSATLRRNGSVSSALWNIDRPFMGDGNDDESAPTTPTMTAPTNITADGFTLNWTGSTDNVYVQYYEITVATDSAFTSLVTAYSAKNVGLVNTLDVTGLTPATNYYAQVRALDAALNASAASTYNSNAAIVTSTSGDITPPNAPVATAASSVTYQSFTANWNASTSSDETGYKLDVAFDSDFTDILPNYRNLDVGNVTTYAINLGILSSTTYYYRVRAYDAATNESLDSNVITVVTAQAPDVTAPNIVVLQPATSVAATSFTANWEEGSDDIGVTGYFIDLSQEEDFSSFVVENLNVGNVTAYAFSGLDSVTGYYYRVRAYDAAGNISANNGTPEQVFTSTELVDQGGNLSVVSAITKDTYTKQNDSGSNHGLEDLIWVKGDTATKWYGYLSFDISGIEGQLANADLSLYIDEFSENFWDTGTGIEIQVVEGDWDETTLTYANAALTPVGDIIEFYPSTWGYVTVDIGSLLISGATTYTIRLNGPDTKTATIVSSQHSDDTKHPYLSLITDPSLVTQIDAIDVDASNLNYTNLLKNPSAEIGGPSFGGTTGITLLSTATLTQSTDFVFDGTYSVKVVTSTSAGSGVSFASNTGLALAGTGQTIKAVAHLYTTGDTTVYQLALKLTYTDATSTTGTAVTAYTLGGNWIRHQMTAVATSGKTVDKVEILLTQTNTTSKTIYIDACAVVDTTYDIVSFSGGSNSDTDWNGTANASTSTLGLVKIDTEVSYLGDTDEDNTVVTWFNEAGSSEVFQYNDFLPTNNHTTKQVTWTVPPITLVNYLFNPSFDYSTSSWALFGSTGFSATYADVVRNNIGASYGFQALDATGGLQNTDLKIAAQGETWNFSAYVNNFDSDNRAFKVQIQELSSTMLVLATQEQSFNSIVDGGWVRASLGVTLTNASTRFIRVRIIATTAMFLYVDDCQLTKQLLIMPYNSGDTNGGAWTGIAGKSESYYRILHDTLYDVNVEFDDYAIIGTNPVSERILTPSVAEDVVTLGTLTLIPESTRLLATFTYSGDDNESAIFYMQYKRKDLNNWNNVAYSLNRSTRTITAIVSGLKTGTLYQVRVLVTDNDDLVYGGVAVTANQAYALAEEITLVDTTLTGSESTLISFNGFVLQGGTQNWLGVTSHDAYSLPDRDVEIKKLARQHGSVELSNYWEKKTITVEGIIKADTRIELEDRLREFRREMAYAGKNLIIDTFDSKGYYWIATCESLSISEEAGRNYKHLEWTAKFVCADPFRYAPTDTVELPLELENNDEVMITNDGDLSLNPIFTITTESADDIYLTLFNETTSERIYSTEPLSAGQTLVIDTSKATISKNSVKIDYEGSFPTLQVGPNTISVALTGGSVFLTVQRRHRYF